MVEAGNKMFCLPGTKIPEWFTRCTRGESISFWFRRNFPAISIGLVIGVVNEQPITVKFSPRVFINGKKQYLANKKVYEFKITTDHIFLCDLKLLKCEENEGEVFSENEWNLVEVSYEDHISSKEASTILVAKQSGIHVLNQTSSMEDIQFTYPNYKNRKSDFLLGYESQDCMLLKEKHRSVDMEVSKTQFIQKQQHMVLRTMHVEYHRKRLSKVPAQVMHVLSPQRVKFKTTAARSWKAQTIMPSSPLLTSTQPAYIEAEKGKSSRPTPSVERPCEHAEGETTERLPENEIHPTKMQNEPLVNEDGRGGDDVELEAVSFSKRESEEIFCSAEGSDSDDPFDWVNAKLSVSRKQTTSSAASSGDASLTSIRGAIDALELLMIKDLSEVSSDHAMQSQLDHLLDLLSTSSHPKVTIEVKEALVEFKTKAFASLEEFQSTVESMNKLKNFEKQRARIQQKTVAGKDRRKDLKNLIKKASLAIKASNCRKKELETEIATLREQLAMKESNLEQLVLNVKNQEATHSTYLTTCASLDEQAWGLLKEADDLFTANIGVEDEGEVAEIKQNRLKSTWSSDLTNQFIMIKKILGRCE